MSLKNISLLLLIYCWIILLSAFSTSTLIKSISVDTSPVKHIEKPKSETIIDKIVKYSKEYNFDLGDAFRIVDCESEFGTNLVNPDSSARGVYQFTYGTWNHYCEGDVMNADDNIKCFFKVYPEHPEWWKCK